jgi:DNA polymerase I-like protein with 3'-5' exonuclease and polymerase domains
VDGATSKSYHRTTVYLTDEQRQWLNRIAAQARLDGLSLSAADVVRLAIVRLRQQLSDDELRQALIEHVHTEAEQYPGRVKRGLPGT